LAGVAILVPDVLTYLILHVKGISKFVPDEKIPKEYRAAFVKAKKDIFEELIEEDLESDRVNMLYVMNHYLRVSGSKVKWWRPVHGDGSDAIETLVKKFWDQGPLDQVPGLFNGLDQRVVELGCGVGGLYHRISMHTKFFLGVDSAFQSILLARHFNLGTEYPGELKVPEDLIQGPTSRAIQFPTNPKAKRDGVDFIVGDIEFLPVETAAWDVAVSMNTIDMLRDPRLLPELQHSLLKKGGYAIQSDPYIWHDKVARRIRNQLPKTIATSSAAVEYLYEKVGFKIEKSYPHIPWVFFKHLRQVELYSVQLFLAKKP
jgi:SAM-dependent methyltransferase